MSLFLQWKEQFEKAGPGPDLASIYDKLNTQIKGPSQSQCNFVAELLNQVIQENSFDEYANEILRQIEKASSSLSENSLQLSESSNNFKITSKEVGRAWAAFYAKEKEIEENEKMLKNTQGAYNELEQLKKIALSANAKLNQARGQFLESFLHGFSLILQGELNSVANNAVGSLLAEFNQGVKNNDVQLLSGLVDLGMKTIVSSRDLSKTEGSLRGGSVDVVIGEEKIKTISSQQKVDVTIPSPFLDGVDWYVSAKNYSTLRNINILGKGSLVGLISQQGMTASESKYMYNALTIPSSKSGWVSSNMDQMKKIFALQALTGQKATENKANVLCLTINDRKKPFRIISIPSLLEKIFEKNSTMAKSAFIFNPELESSLPIGDTDARDASIFNALNNFVVSVELSKAVLTLQYINQLS